jgi:serine/threonine-protein kinase
MWQRSGSVEAVPRDAADDYVRQLNAAWFAGHSDWRLPTIEELASLVRPDKGPQRRCVDPVFDQMQDSLWSCDTVTDSNAPAAVDLYDGAVVEMSPDSELYVRAVRSLKH